MGDGPIVVVLLGGVASSSVGDLSSTEGEEQEEEGSDELANDGNELVADIVRKPTKARETVFMLIALAVLHEGEGDTPAWAVEIHD